jgi:hypothetical protein
MKTLIFPPIHKKWSYRVSEYSTSPTLHLRFLRSFLQQCSSSLPLFHRRYKTRAYHGSGPASVSPFLALCTFVGESNL